MLLQCTKCPNTRLFCWQQQSPSTQALHHQSNTWKLTSQQHQSPSIQHFRFIKQDAIWNVLQSSDIENELKSWRLIFYKGKDLSIVMHASPIKQNCIPERSVQYWPAFCYRFVNLLWLRNNSTYLLYAGFQSQARCLCKSKLNQHKMVESWHPRCLVHMRTTSGIFTILQSQKTASYTSRAFVHSKNSIRWKPSLQDHVLVMNLYPNQSPHNDTQHACMQPACEHENRDSVNANI